MSEVAGEVGKFGGIPLVTDHRCALNRSYMVPFESLSEWFADRSMVKDGCICSYCTWSPPDE